MALNSLLRADVPLRNCSLTHFSVQFISDEKSVGKMDWFLAAIDCRLLRETEWWTWKRSTLRSKSVEGTTWKGRAWIPVLWLMCRPPWWPRHLACWHALSGRIASTWSEVSVHESPGSTVYDDPWGHLRQTRGGLGVDDVFDDVMWLRHDWITRPTDLEAATVDYPRVSPSIYFADNPMIVVITSRWLSVHRQTVDCYNFTPNLS